MLSWTAESPRLRRDVVRFCLCTGPGLLIYYQVMMPYLEHTRATTGSPSSGSVWHCGVFALWRETGLIACSKHRVALADEEKHAKHLMEC